MTICLERPPTAAVAAPAPPPITICIPQYAEHMTESTRITVTLPSDQVEAMRALTDNISAFVATAVGRQVRGMLLDDDLRTFEAEHGAFTDAEMAEARAELEAAVRTGRGGENP